MQMSDHTKQNILYFLLLFLTLKAKKSSNIYNNMLLNKYPYLTHFCLADYFIAGLFPILGLLGAALFYFIFFFYLFFFFFAIFILYLTEILTCKRYRS